MLISSVPTDQAVVKAAAVIWLHRLLDHQDFYYSSIPNEIKCYLYIDNTPRIVTFGSWQIDSTHVYLPGRSSSVEPLTKLSILAAIAAVTKANEDPEIIAKITSRLAVELNNATRSVYGSIVSSNQRPTRLAINHQELQVAAEINGTWVLTNGAPITVTGQWIIMDF